MMAVRNFFQKCTLLRTGRIFFGDARTQTNFVHTNFKALKQWKQPKPWNFTKKFQKTLLITSSGLLGFKFGDDDEKIDSESELIMSIKRSIFLIQKEEFKKAEQLLHVALRQAQTLQNDRGITYIYHVMADLAFQIGEFEKAKSLYISVMQRLISNGTSQNDLKIVQISLKIAKLCEQNGDLSMAEDGYQFCMQNMDANVKENPDDEDTLILWATSKDWYARLLMTQSRFREALDNFLQAYQTCIQVNGKNHEWSVMLMNDLGMVSCVLGQLDNALDYLNDAIEIGKNLTEIDLSEIYINLGFVYIAKSLYKEANEACLMGLKYAKQNGKESCQEEANNCLTEVRGKF